MKNDFEARYRSGDLPWDHGLVDDNLVRTIEGRGIKPCKTLDIGCGTGDNAIWLASQGFDAVGCDFSETAIKLAKQKADTSGAGGHFLVADILKDSIPGGPFDFVFDRGCLHCIEEAGGKKLFARKVYDLLNVQRLWLTLVGNADEPEREDGPPQLSAEALISVVEPFFEILSLTSGYFGSDQDDPPRAWICLLRKRD